MTLRWRTAIRVMPAVWFGPAIWLLAAWYATSVPAADRYALAASANGSAALPFIAAYVGAVSAWEGSRLRRGGIWGAPWARTTMTIAARPIAVAVMLGFVAVLAAVELQLARSGASAPDARILIVAAVDLIAWGVVGFAVGVTIPLAAATPIALILPVLWLAFVPAVDPVWLRHITGMFRDCCRTDEDLAPAALVVSLAVDAAFVVAAWIVAVASAGRLWRHLAFAVVWMVAAVVAASSRVSSLDYAPTVARDSSSLVCRQLPSAELCLWPEHVDRADKLAAVTADVLRRWQLAGLTSPVIVTEAHQRVAPPAALVVSFADVHGDDAAIASLARGAVPPPPQCPSDTPGAFSATTGAVAEPYLEAWYAFAGGLSPSWISATYDEYGSLGGPVVADIVSQLAAASPEARARWVSKVTSFITTCDPIEPDVTVDP